MTKKTTRKPNLPQETLERARRELAKEGVQVETVAPASNTVPSRATTPKPIAPRAKIAHSADLRAEYAYVIADLQQMALLAGGLVVGLVILSFFI